MNSNGQRTSIQRVARKDEGLFPGIQSLMRLAPNEKLFPLGIAEVRDGKVLVVGTAGKNRDSDSISLDGPFVCLVLLREGTEAEVREHWYPDQRPEYVELLQVDLVAQGFVRTGESEGYLDA